MPGEPITDLAARLAHEFERALGRDIDSAVYGAIAEVARAAAVPAGPGGDTAPEPAGAALGQLLDGAFDIGPAPDPGLVALDPRDTRRTLDLLGPGRALRTGCGGVYTVRTQPTALSSGCDVQVVRTGEGALRIGILPATGTGAVALWLAGIEGGMRSGATPRLWRDRLAASLWQREGPEGAAPEAFRPCAADPFPSFGDAREAAFERLALFSPAALLTPEAAQQAGGDRRIWFVIEWPFEATPRLMANPILLDWRGGTGGTGEARDCLAGDGTADTPGVLRCSAGPWSHAVEDDPSIVEVALAHRGGGKGPACHRIDAGLEGAAWRYDRERRMIVVSGLEPARKYDVSWVYACTPDAPQPRERWSMGQPCDAVPMEGRALSMAAMAAPALTGAPPGSLGWLRAVLAHVAPLADAVALDHATLEAETRILQKPSGLVPVLCLSARARGMVAAEDAALCERMIEALLGKALAGQAIRMRIETP